MKNVWLIKLISGETIFTNVIKEDSDGIVIEEPIQHVFSSVDGTEEFKSEWIRWPSIYFNKRQIELDFYHIITYDKNDEYQKVYDSVLKKLYANASENTEKINSNILVN